jgi:delta24-sterol reductase
MDEHNRKVQVIAAAIKEFSRRKQPFRLYHESTGRTNTIRLDPKKIIDTSRLNNVLFIDKDARIAISEPNVDMETLLNAALKENLVPLVVTELSSLTVGGGFAGMAGECSSFKFGPFNATCSEIEIVTGDGEIRICSEREDQHPELFHAAAGSCGTIGVITLIKVRLMPAKPYVQLTLYHADSAAKVHRKTLEAMTDSDITDYIETVLFSADESLLMIGHLIDEPKDKSVSIFKCWQPSDGWFYHEIKRLSADLTKESRTGKSSTRTIIMPLVDYLFRHDRGAFWGGDLCLDYFFLPNNRVVRRLFDSCLRSGSMYHGLHRSGLAQKYIIQDLVFASSRVVGFLKDFDAEWKMYPISFCPLVKGARVGLNPTQGIVDDANRTQEVVWNVGTYGMRKFPKLSVEEENRKLVELVRHHNGVKWTYCESWMTEEEFRQDYDLAQLEDLRVKYDSTWLPALYDKVKTDAAAIEKTFTQYWGFWNIRPLAGAYGGISAIIGRDYLLEREGFWKRLFRHAAFQNSKTHTK